MEDTHTPVPWDGMTAVLVRAGDPCVLLSGSPPIVDCRVLAEPHFQYAKKCVNAHGVMKALLRRCLPACLDDKAPLTVDIKELLDSLDNPKETE